MIAPKASEVIALGAVLPIVTLIMVFLRFLSKKQSFKSYTYREHRFGLDDYLILLPMLLLMFLSGIIIAGAVQGGYGHQSDDRSSEAGFNDQSSVLVRTKLYTNFYNWTFPWMYGCTKQSVLFFYRSIFQGRAFNITSWALIVICALWTIISFFFALLQCHQHVEYLWSSAANIATHCMSGMKIAMPIAALDVFTDVCILSLPIYWVWHLQMRLWKRMAVCVVFLFGSLTVVSSIIRLIMFSLVFPHHNSMADQLGYLTTVAYWGVLEGGLSIMAACLPTLGPLLSQGSGQQGGWAVSLAYNLERGWCIMTRQDTPNDPRSCYNGSGSDPRSSRPKSYIGRIGTTIRKDRNGSQSGASATEALVNDAYQAHAYPPDDVKGKPVQTVELNDFATSHSQSLEQQSVLVQKDITVEHNTIQAATRK